MRFNQGILLKFQNMAQHPYNLLQLSIV